MKPRRPYVWPSECDQCTPQEVHDCTNEHVWSVTYSHQEQCPNHPSAKPPRRTP